MFWHAAESVSILCNTQAKDQGEEGKPPNTIKQWLSG